MRAQPPRALDVQSYIASLVPEQARDEGFQFGDPQVEVRGIVVAWMATVDAIKAAAGAGANLMVVHEALFYPYDALEKGGPPGFLSWRTNWRRAELLCHHGIAVIRAHGTLDRVCIFDDFAALLGLGQPVVDEPGLVKVYEIPPTPLRNLARRVRARTGMRGLRVVTGDPERLVRRVGLPWGGLGLFVNVAYLQKLVLHDCDVFIAGESDSYGMRFALEAGVDLVETSHEVSENPGLARFAVMLQERFPTVPVIFHENEQPWRLELGTRPLILAHRGASAYAPENTLAAFDLAVEMGAPAVETDVRATADGHLVLLHDGRVDRTTDGHGLVSELSLAEVQSLDAGAWFGPQFAGQRVPTLAEFLDHYARRIPICLEVKAADVEAQLVELVRKVDLLDEVVFTSFSLETVIRLRALAPQARIGYLVRACDRFTIDQTLLAGANQICPHAAALTAEGVRAARARGLEVRAWGVSDDNLLARAISLGVDGLTTNWPDRAMRLLAMTS